MTGFSHVLFDLDGTLTDSQSGIVASYRHTLEAFGLTAPDDDIRRSIGPPLPDSLVGLGVTPGQIDSAVAVYRQYFGRAGIFDNRLYPGIADMLTALAESGTILAVTTSKLEQFAVSIVDHFGIAGRFTVVVGATADGRRRHKEDIVGHALDVLDPPDRRRVTVVGDREHDVFAAREHALYAIGVSWGYGSEAELRAAGVAEIFDTVSQLQSALLDRAGPGSSSS